MAIKIFLIAGYGYVGNRLATALRTEYSDAVIITLNRKSGGPDKSGSAIDMHITCNLDQAEQVPEVSLPVNLDAVFYLVPPPQTGQEDTRIRNFLHIMGSHIPDKIVAISTTGVYGDCKGAWVDETFPVRPQTDRARRRVSAENQLLAWAQQSGKICLILRVPGIYGPGKLPIERLLKSLPVLRENESPWSNRVHVDDLVQACIQAYRFGDHSDFYNISDGKPSTMTDYFMHVADTFAIPRPPVIGMAEARKILSGNMLSYLQESKKIDNAKMLRELHVVLQYPDLPSGLAACQIENAE